MDGKSLNIQILHFFLFFNSEKYIIWWLVSKIEKFWNDCFLGEVKKDKIWRPVLQASQFRKPEFQSLNRIQ